MKVSVIFLLSLLVVVIGVPAQGGLLLTGVLDGPITGGLPKAIELYATADIPDLSIYGVGSANNGGGTDGEEFDFPAVSALAGEFLYLATESTQFQNFFGFAPDFTDGNATLINGDDAIELFMNGSVVDVFGDISVDGTGQPWAYHDGWAYRADGTGPDGSTFDLGSWRFSGINALDGETSNATAATAVPVGAYDPVAAVELVLTGVVDGPITGGLPKAVELYVTRNISDLSIYGLGAANNGGGSDGIEFTFPVGPVSAGEFLYLATESPQFQNFFGFAPDFLDGNATLINGDDAIELFMNNGVVDVFGEINVDGTGQPWEYMDGWAYRVDGTGPDGSVFVLANWTFSGRNALDGETTNAGATTPFPVNAYVVPEPSTLAIWLLGTLGLIGWRKRRR